jgi:hypothetical protein
VPPQEGGVDYKEQYELMQLANLALLDQISKLQHHTNFAKEIVEVIIYNTPLISCVHLEKRAAYITTATASDRPKATALLPTVVISATLWNSPR